MVSIPKQLVVDASDLPEPHHDSMEVAVTSSLGAAIAEIEAKQVCDLLSEISNAVSDTKTPDSLGFYQRTIYCLASGGGAKSSPSKASR